MNLSLIDILIIAVYVLSSAVIGILFSRKALKSVNDYFVTGRILPWWLAGVSMIASAFAIDTPLGITGMVAENGIPGVWYAWSFILGGVGAFGAFILASLFRRSEIITIPELIELRYEGKAAAFLRGFKGVYFGVFSNAITLGWIIKAVWTMSEVVVPQANRHILLAVILLFTLFYTAISGLWGIAATDAIQFIVGSIGSFLLAFYALNHIGGIDNVISGFIERYGEVDAANRLSFLPTVGTSFFVTFIVFITLKWWANPTPAIAQRIFATRDEKHASFATLFFAVVVFGINYWPMILVAMVSLVTFPTLASPEAGYPMLIVQLLPSGLLGLMLASLIAAFMSTVDSHINYGASFIVNDIYRRFIKRKASEKHYVRASQLSTVFMLLLSVFVAYNLESVSDAWYYMSMLTAGYGFIVVIRWFWWRVNAWAEISGLVSSGIGSTLFSPRVAKYFGYWDVLPHEFGYRFAIVFFLAAAVSTLVCLLTPPEPEERLVKFCKKVKPYPVFWGEIYKKYPDLGWNEHFGRALMHWAIGALSIFACCFGLGHFLFKNYLFGSILLLISVSAGLIIYKTWRK